MLFNLLKSNDFELALLSLLLTLPSVLIALTFHEAAHGYVAYKMGDPTAKALGRLTLNPFKHLDPIGSILMLVTGYGWAKPVPINTRYFKNQKKGMALTALAGPMMNLLLGIIGVIAYAFIARFGNASNLFIYVLWLFFYHFAVLNITYAVFNMIPLPPFDGSRVFLTFLPPKQYFGIMRYERIIMIVVLLGMATGILWTPVEMLADLLLTGIEKLVFLIF